MEVPIATANIKNGMTPLHVKACVTAATHHCRILAAQERQGTHFQAALPNHWKGVQAAGSRGRCALGFDASVYSLVDWGTQMVCKSHVIPSGTRYDLWVVLESRNTHEQFVIVNGHSVAHIDHGGKPGWTGKGALTNKISHRLPNPLVPVYRDWSHGHWNLVSGLYRESRNVLAVGDWNVDAYADRRHFIHGDACKFFPHTMMHQRDVTSCFMALGFHGRGTDGSRYIDQIAVKGRGTFESYDIRSGLYSDHHQLHALVSLR